ncbi:MAG: hypothetical protein WDW36_005999 [Sanguina aurantia]
MEVEISGAESSHTRYDGLASLDEGVQMTAAELLLDAEFKLDMQLLQEQQRQRLQQANLEQLTASQAPASQYVRTQPPRQPPPQQQQHKPPPPRQQQHTLQPTQHLHPPSPSTPTPATTRRLQTATSASLRRSQQMQAGRRLATPTAPGTAALTHGTRRACSTRQPPGNPRHPPSRLPRGSRGGSRFSDAGAGSGVAEAAVAVAVQVSWVGEAVDKARVAMAEVGKAHRSAAEEAAIEFDGLLGGDLMQGQWGASWGAEEWGTEGSMTSA